MENNNFPPADCNLHKKKVWNVKQTFVVYPSHLTLVEKVVYVHVNLQVKFEFEKNTTVCLQPLAPNMIPLLIQTAKEIQELSDSLEVEGFF